MHAVKDELPAAASESVGHAEHVLSDVCATTGEYLPASHSSQAVLTPDAALYLPASHSTQTVIPICDAYLPAPHVTHSASPSLAVYFPVHRQWHNSAKESKGIACAEPNSPPHGRGMSLVRTGHSAYSIRWRGMSVQMQVSTRCN